MSIESTIKNMEEALEKKKAVMREKSASKITKLKERIKTKNEKIERITKERDALVVECGDLESDLNVAGTETKAETFVPGKNDSQKNHTQNDDNKKTPPKKK